MRAVSFLSMALITSFIVVVRRLFVGPLHVGWTLRYEVLAALLQRLTRLGVKMPVTEMRRGIVSARIYPEVLAMLRHERGTLAGLRTETFTPNGWKESDGTIFYLHGGGYVVCSPATHRDLISRIAATSSARAVAIDYRKAPEDPFPAAIDDAEAAYRELLASGVSSERLYVAGDSAGGGLALALLLRLRDASTPLPRAAILLSPWVDLEATGESIRTNARFDYLPAESLAPTARLYLHGADPRHPQASAVHADLRTLPPLLVQTGGAEMLLSENVRLVARATEAGVQVSHQIEPGHIHVFQAFATFVKEARPAIERIGAFVKSHARAA